MDVDYIRATMVASSQRLLQDWKDRANFAGLPCSLAWLHYVVDLVDVRFFDAGPRMGSQRWRITAL